MASISFDELVAAAHDTAGADDPLARLEVASAISASLADTADALLTHFVDQCRADGRSWAEIGAALGVSKQAAQKRFADGTLRRATERTRRVLEAAREIADDQGTAALRLDHLVLALFSEPTTIGARVLRNLGVTQQALEDAIGRRSRARGARLAATPPADQAILATALELGHNYIGTEHVLLACYRDPTALVARALNDVGAREPQVRAAVRAALSTARPHS